MPQKILYILGVGRSGSTLLNSILGNDSQIFGCSELVHACHPLMKDVKCACGQLFYSCPVWSEIIRQFKYKFGEGVLEELLALQQKLEMYHTPLDGKHSVIFRNISRVTKIKFPSIGVGKSKFSRYSELIAGLFQIISSITCKPIIVDSSKSPLRAQLFAEIFTHQFFVIRIVRDGRAAINSSKKQLLNSRKQLGWDVSPIPAGRTIAGWIKDNLLCDVAYHNFPVNQRIQIRYEDLVARPVEIVTQIADLLNYDLNEINQLITQNKPLTHGHSMSGSRLRDKPIMSIKLDQDWEKNLSKRELWMFHLAAGWLNKRYGY